MNGSNGYHIEVEVDAGELESDFRPAMVKRPRPKKLHGATYRKETPLGTAYITVNSDERDQPFEVFMNVGKAGTEVTAVSEAMGRLISLVLRMPAALPPTERLRWVTEELVGIGGGRPLGFGANRVRSLPDGVAQVLAEHLSDLPQVEEEAAARAAGAADQHQADRRHLPGMWRGQLPQRGRLPQVSCVRLQ